MKAVVRVRRGKSWRYVVRGAVGYAGEPVLARHVMRSFMAGAGTRLLAHGLRVDPTVIEQVIREARGARWWRE